MRKFLAIYKGSALTEEQKKNAKPLNPEAQQAGMMAWGSWVQKNQKLIVDMGSPLGKTKSVGPYGIKDTRNRDTAYVIIEAESHEAAAKLFLDHPHFSIFPGDSIEVMECLSMPGAQK